MREAGALRRHDMVQVEPQAWAGLLARRPDLAAIPLVADWCARGWPLVHRRGMACDAPGEIPLGLPLPPYLSKRRLSCTLPQAAMQHATPPPLLRDAADVAPTHWRGTLERLVALTPEARVFGSLAWQHLTALAYMSATSDLDVLWPLPARDPRRLLDGIAAIAAVSPMRIDGEFFRPDGSGACWRDLAMSTEILIKQPGGIVLMQRHDFLEAAR